MLSLFSTLQNTNFNSIRVSNSISVAFLLRSVMGAQEKSPTAKHSMQRVKVYRLSGDGKWDDQGTGHVTVDYLEVDRKNWVCLLLMKKTMKHYFRTVLVQMIFTEKEDTIISWRDPEFSTELALSFQETTGCSYICNETYHSVNSELRELPAVELSTLPIILKMSSSNVNGGTSNQLT
ncbi:unnamed protein product [Camellia sinensis]